KLGAPPGAVAVDPQDARRRKTLAQRFLDALGAAAHRLEIDVAAGGAGLRDRRLRAAVMATQAPVCGMHHQRRAAAGATRVPAAGLAGEDRCVAAPVDEYQGLLAALQPLADGLQQSRR